MKFGETFQEYLHGDREQFLHKCSHIEYKKLKKVLKRCRACQALNRSCKTELHQGKCQCESCPVCDEMFFPELTKEASDIVVCFSSRVKHLLHLHIANGVQGCMLRLLHCFSNNQQAMVQEGRILMEYITMNAIAITKILKKYDKVHSSANGKIFKSKMRTEHIELLQSPWLMELGAFCLNFNGLVDGEFSNSCGHFSCDLNTTEPVMTLILPNNTKLEYSLTCAICLETVCNPYALSCGHLFCRLCACSAASMPVFEGLKTASPEAKCPVCRETGVYGNAVHMLELGLLFKNRCKDYWRERMAVERAELTKQVKEYWEAQTRYSIGY
ncbi:hypothetical protein K2173_024163 [Erythroxylum novogranatense]|uniref:RING-type E3 ubiquitin transferase n=1 Tax=Erythroxylum novogranatense TaxID=1862640 RepID=A0AAV8UCB9_9ROSI|nr:hypothetical protein K2173_024163 [Erythroxylum novogranatense]